MTIGECAYWACVLEASAEKLGNVHPTQSFPDLNCNDLIKSAIAVAPILDQAVGKPVGEIVYECIRATQAVVDTNTNLGIVLMLAPLAASEDIAAILASLTVADAERVYGAIRLAQPGGLGKVDQQDVSETPTVTLLEAMAFAVDRDSIARQYVTNFGDVYAGAEYLVSLQRSTNWLGLARAIVDLQLWYLCRLPDSLVARKRGIGEARELQQIALAVGSEPNRLDRMKEWFAAAWPHRNPGTTADLVCASLFVALRRRSITLPPPAEWPEIYQ